MHSEKLATPVHEMVLEASLEVAHPEAHIFFLFPPSRFLATSLKPVPVRPPTLLPHPAAA